MPRPKEEAVPMDKVKYLAALRRYDKLYRGRLTLKRIARVLGVSASTVHCWEHGNRSMSLGYGEFYLKVLASYYRNAYGVDIVKDLPYKTEGEKMLWIMAKYNISLEDFMRHIRRGTRETCIGLILECGDNKLFGKERIKEILREILRERGEEV